MILIIWGRSRELWRRPDDRPQTAIVGPTSAEDNARRAWLAWNLAGVSSARLDGAAGSRAGHHHATAQEARAEGRRAADPQYTGRDAPGADPRHGERSD